MGDFNKFQNSFLYYSFYALLICIIASEVFIFLFTYQKGTGKAKKHYYDKGTKSLFVFIYPFGLSARVAL